MTPLEAAALCRFTKAVCPQQAIDEYTPDAWHPLLEDIRFDDAKDAVIKVGQSQPFIAPAEIRTEVYRVRRQRLSDFGPLPNPPAELGDEEQARWLRRTSRAIADGQHVEAPALPAGPRHVIDYAALLDDDPATRSAAMQAARAAVGGGGL